MKKSSGKSKKSAPQVDPLLEGMMSKLLDRLSQLDRKMDEVMSVLSTKLTGGGENRSAMRDQNQVLQAKERIARRERILYEAICADCNVPCEVPFRPTEGRAIYCKECFAKRRSAGMSRVPAPAGPPPPDVPSASAVNGDMPPKPAAKSKKKQPAKKSKKK